ncbi:MAG: hypothetical protein QXM16_04955 [Nitrososphaerota archaeon]
MAPPPLLSAYCVKDYIPYLVVGIRKLVLDKFTGIPEGRWCRDG